MEEGGVEVFSEVADVIVSGITLFQEQEYQLSKLGKW